MRPFAFAVLLEDRQPVAVRAPGPAKKHKTLTLSDSVLLYNVLHSSQKAIVAILLVPARPKALLRKTSTHIEEVLCLMSS